MRLNARACVRVCACACACVGKARVRMMNQLSRAQPVFPGSTRAAAVNNLYHPESITRHIPSMFI